MILAVALAIGLEVFLRRDLSVLEAERDAAIAQRNVAISQREEAIAQRDELQTRLDSALTAATAPQLTGSQRDESQRSSDSTTRATVRTTTTTTTTTVAVAAPAAERCFTAVMADLGIYPDAETVDEPNWWFPTALSGRCSDDQFMAALLSMSETMFEVGDAEDPCEFVDYIYYGTPRGSKAEELSLDASLLCPDVIGNSS